MLSEKKGADTEEWELGEAIWNIYILADQKLKQEAEGERERVREEDRERRMDSRWENGNGTYKQGGCSQRKLP